MSNHDQQAVKNAAANAAEAAMNQVNADTANANAGIRPTFDDEECAEGFATLSLPTQLLVGGGVAALAGAAGYGAMKGTTALIAGEVAVAEGAMVGGIVGGSALVAAAPIAAAVAVAGGVGYAAWKGVQYLTRDRVAQRPGKKAQKPQQQQVQQTPPVDNRTWPLPMSAAQA